MIAALALTMALAFWQPYSPQPVCSQGVTISYFTDADHPAEPGLRVWGYSIQGARDCTISVNVDLPYEPVEFQCAIIAHELGHEELGLDHSANPRDIMFWIVPTPTACKLPPPPKAPLKSKRAKAKRPAHLRPEAFHA